MPSGPAPPPPRPHLSDPSKPSSHVNAVEPSRKTVTSETSEAGEANYRHYRPPRGTARGAGEVRLVGFHQVNGQRQARQRSPTCDDGLTGPIIVVSLEGVSKGIGYGQTCSARSAGRDLDRTGLPCVLPASRLKAHTTGCADRWLDITADQPTKQPDVRRLLPGRKLVDLGLRACPTCNGHWSREEHTALAAHWERQRHPA